MDEIDAALDFRNVSIVANYIKDRTKNAQFIIISLRWVSITFISPRLACDADLPSCFHLETTCLSSVTALSGFIRRPMPQEVSSFPVLLEEEVKRTASD